MMSPKSRQTLSILVTHFGDTRWTRLLINRILETSSEEVLEIYILNQDRNDNSLIDLTSSSLKISIVNAPKWALSNVSSSLGASYDHGSSLNYAMSNLEFLGSYILILDNDCFPMNQNWINSIQSLLREHSAMLAEAPKTFYLTHPCFMLIPKYAIKNLDFLQGMIELGFDTGRLIGLQLSSMHIKPNVQLSTREYKGIGWTYLNRNFLHLVATSYSQWRKQKFGDFIRFQDLKMDFKYYLLDRWYLDGFRPLSRTTFSRYMISFVLSKKLFTFRNIVKFFSKIRIK